MSATLIVPGVEIREDVYEPVVCDWCEEPATTRYHGPEERLLVATCSRDSCRESAAAYFRRLADATDLLDCDERGS